MSLITSASLILTPNGYKSQKLYSIIPSTGDGDLTFTRATTATRVNSSGLVENIPTTVPRLNYSGSVPHWLLEPQRTNLQLQSSNFTTSWTLNNSATVTSNSTISPDGTQNADTIDPATTPSSGVYQFVTVSSGAKYTFSVYIKNISTATSITIGCDTNPSTALLDYNPTTKTIITNGAGIISSSVVNAGNDWYRVSGTYTSTGTANDLVIYSQNSSGIPFAVWGAQLESGSYATSYIPTTTSTVTRNADITLVTGVSSLIGQTEGTLFIEWAPGDLGLDTNSNIMGIYSSTGNNRLSLYFDVYGGSPHLTIDLTKNSTSTYFTPSIPLTNTNFRKLAVVYKSNSMYIFENGVKIYTNNSTGVTFPLTQQLETLTFSPYNKTNKVRNAQIYPMALTDAECIALTTL